MTGHPRILCCTRMMQNPDSLRKNALLQRMFKYNWAVREDWFKWYEEISEFELLEKSADGVGGILHTPLHAKLDPILFMLYCSIEVLTYRNLTVQNGSLSQTRELGPSQYLLLSKLEKFSPAAIHALVRDFLVKNETRKPCF